MFKIFKHNFFLNVEIVLYICCASLATLLTQVIRRAPLSLHTLAFTSVNSVERFFSHAPIREVSVPGLNFASIAFRETQTR